MPFITLNNDFSKLASYYNAASSNGSFGNVNNVTYTQKPQIPKESNQYTTSDSGLIRGGFINTALSIKNDFNNFTNYFYKTEKGTTFVLRQIGLQLSNPLLEQLVTIKRGKETWFLDENNKYTGKATSPDTKKSNPIGSTRIYNGGINTLASISGTALGFHFPNFGSSPFSGYDYAKIAKTNNNNSKDDAGNISPSSPTLKPIPANSISTLNEVVVTSFKKGKNLPSPLTIRPNRLISYLGKLTENGNSANPVILQSYFGGSESVYGIGRTTIKTTGDSVTNKSGRDGLTYRDINKIGNILKPTTGDNSHIGYYYGASETETITINEQTQQAEK